MEGLLVVMVIMYLFRDSERWRQRIRDTKWALPGGATEDFPKEKGHLGWVLKHR
jgi:hypothetical protein